MTEAESVLWQCLRAKQLKVQFLRQHVIGDYIVDFACRESGLIVEVDGAYHSEPVQQDADEIRQHDLEGYGYRVIRFTNEEVLCDIDNVISKIEKELQ